MSPGIQGDAAGVGAVYCLLPVMLPGGEPFTVYVSPSSGFSYFVMCV